jgi:hypothetical protein
MLQLFCHDPWFRQTWRRHVKPSLTCSPGEYEWRAADGRSLQWIINRIDKAQ